MRILNALFGAAYILSAAVQLNDPDPVPWIALYLSAAATCLTWQLSRCPRALPAALLVTALTWAAWIGAHTTLGVSLREALGDWGMYSEGSEQAREIGGLLVVSLWMAALAWRPAPGARLSPDGARP